MSDEREELAAIVEIPARVLAQLLQLPAGAVIDYARMPLNRPGGPVVFRLRGVGWPVRPGALIPEAHPVLTTHQASEQSPAALSIDWRLPAATGGPDKCD